MPDRDEAARLADHAQIEGLADELLPALIAKLGATGLAELEVREGDWKVRLRRSGGRLARSGRPGRVGPARHGRPAATSSMPTRRLGRAGRRPVPGARPPRRRSGSTSPARRSAPDRGSGPATGSAASTSWASPRRSSRRSTGSSGPGLVESGDAVEYGQELVWIELISTPAERAGRDA